MQSKEPFYKYVEEVLAGKVVVGKYILLAVERFVRDCDRKDYVFDYDEGKRIVKYAALCNHWKGPKAGTPIILDPHQEFYFIQKYGWKDPSRELEITDSKTGKKKTVFSQRFVRTVKLIARKTGKTTEAGLEAVYHVDKGIEQAAQVWTCATKEDDAIILVNDAGRIIEATPGLKKKFKLQIRDPYVRRVSYPKRNAFIAYMTKGQDAVDTSMGFGDECHDWPDASVKQRIESSMGNRLCPSFTNISTAGFNKSGYCYQTLRDKGIKILEGSIQDDLQLIMLYEIDDGDDWKDQDCWIKPNPNLPFSMTQLPYLKKQFTTAINEGGSTETNFKTKNLNMWTDAAAVWIQDEVWMKSGVGIKLEELANLECYGGLYTASTETLNCLVLFFPDVRGQNVFLLHTWLPEKFTRSNNDNVDYQKWVGFINETPGNSADHRIIAKECIEICMRYDVRVVGFDRTFGQYVAPDLEAEGIPVMEIYQGFNNLGQQTEEFKKMVKDGTLDHGKNPVFRWHISNTVTHRNSDGLEKPDKAASGSRIGSVSAALNAMAARFILNKEGQMTDFKFESIR